MSLTSGINRYTGAVNIPAFLAVTAFFVVVNIVAAGLMLGLGVLAIRAGIIDIWLTRLLIGICSVAGAIGFAFCLTAIISRKRPRGLARDRG